MGDGKGDVVTGDELANILGIFIRPSGQRWLRAGNAVAQQAARQRQHVLTVSCSRLVLQRFVEIAEHL
ncbi:hypothetical protein FQZ97_1151500 [compost metagenome]